MKKLLNLILSLLMVIGLTTNVHAEGGSSGWGGPVGTVYKVKDVNETDPQTFDKDGTFFINGVGYGEEQLAALQNKLNSYLDAGYIFADENEKVPETSEDLFYFDRKYALASQQNMPEHTDEQTIKLKHRMDEKTETANVQTSDEKAYRIINFVFNGEESKNYTEKQYGSGEIVETWLEDAVTKKESNRETTSEKSQFSEYPVPEVDGWTADKTVVEEKEYDGTWTPEETVIYTKNTVNMIDQTIKVKVNELCRTIPAEFKIYAVNKTTSERLSQIAAEYSSSVKGYVGEFTHSIPAGTEENYGIEVEVMDYANNINSNLLQYKQLNKWYSVNYDTAIDYTDTDGYVITLTPMSNINGSIIFKDDYRPDEIEVSLTKNGEIIDTLKTNANNNWKFDFGRLVMTDDSSQEIMYDVSIKDINGYYQRSLGYDIEVIPMTKVTLTKELIGTSKEKEFGIYILPNFKSRKDLWLQKLLSRYPVRAHYFGYKWAKEIIDGAERWDSVSDDIPVLPVIDALFDIEDVERVLEKINTAEETGEEANLTKEEVEKGFELVKYSKDWLILEGESKYDLTVQGTANDPDFYDRDALANSDKQFMTMLQWFKFAPDEKGQDWGNITSDTNYQDLYEMLSAYNFNSFEEYIETTFKNNFYFYTTVKPGETTTVELPIENLYSLIIVENDYEDTVEPEMIKIVNYDGIIINTSMTDGEIEQLRFKDYEAAVTNRGTFTPEITNTTVKVGESTAAVEKEATYELGVKEDGVELSDTVEYEGLDDELTYIIKSTLYSDNKEVQTKLTEVKNQNKGSVTVIFDEKVQEGTFDIKTELLLDNKVVFTHNEKLDTKLERATITREIPEDGTLKTTVEGASKSNAVELTAEEASKKISLTDTISYEGLIGGESYTVVGRLMEDGEIEVATVSETMKADESGSGEWKVTLAFEEGTLKPDTKYVVFEKATQVVPEGRTPQTAKHEDPTDLAQTVVVGKAKFPVSILKTDLGGAEVEGATIRVEGDGIVEVWESTKEPHEMKLPAGEYKMTETVAPRGYIPVETDITFTIDEKGNVAVEEIIIDGEVYTEAKDGIITLKNAKAKEYVNTQVTKVWKDDTGEDIDWPVDEIKVLVEYGGESEELTLTKGTSTLTTKDFEKVEDAEFKVTELTELEDFTTQVEKTEEGYAITNAKKPTSDIGEPPVAEKTVVNVEVVKYAEDTKLPLKDAEITIFTEEGEVVLDINGIECIALTDENGKAVFQIYKEDYPSVYVKETKAPEGYRINDNKFDLDTSVEIVNVTVDIYDVPITPDELEPTPTPSEKPDKPTITPKPNTPDKPNVVKEMPKKTIADTSDNSNIPLYVLMFIGSLLAILLTTLKLHKNK